MCCRQEVDVPHGAVTLSAAADMTTVWFLLLILLLILHREKICLLGHFLHLFMTRVGSGVRLI